MHPADNRHGLDRKRRRAVPFLARILVARFSCFPVKEASNRMTPRNGLQHALLLPLASSVFSGSLAGAQAPDRLPSFIDSARVEPLAHHHPQWAVAANDAGAVPAEIPINNITLSLARSSQQEQAFEKLLRDQQDPASPEYHRWLAPDEIGQRFGLSDNNIAVITAWLQSHGLQVNWVSPSRIFVGFTGTAANVDRAFGTETHYYKVNGKELVSVSSDPTIPVALAPAIRSVRGLFTIGDRPFHFAAPEEVCAPNLTISSGGTTYHFLAPGDLATIYDLPAGVTGAGTTIGIVAEARTVTPTGGFSGTVALSVAITSSPTGAQDLPTFNWTPSGAEISLSGSSPVNATLTIVTTPSTVGENQRPANPAARWYGPGGAALACVVLFWIPSRRRGLRNMLTIVALFAALGGGLLACGGNSNTVGGGNSRTTSCTYTITVTGTSGSTSVTTPVSLTVE